ncbi:MAG TPA: ribonuclease HI family protein [Candidatus Thermoplasmatota archaeon]|nr:ribonuclease HI family protein [Candidatus Thermoplasmatota archaeon]
MHATVWFDGCCLGNPGPMGAGAVVQTERERKVLRKAFGQGTNNQAEYHGLILGLRHALVMDAETVTVHGDSQLILRQLGGEYAVKAPGLKALHAEAKMLLSKFSKVKLEWVPREENGEADQASRDALRRPLGQA